MGDEWKVGHQLAPILFGRSADCHDRSCTLGLVDLASPTDSTNSRGAEMHQRDLEGDFDVAVD